jgi:hypothetical protein
MERLRPGCRRSMVHAARRAASPDFRVLTFNQVEGVRCGPKHSRRVQETRWPTR